MPKFFFVSRDLAYRTRRHSVFVIVGGLQESKYVLPLLSKHRSRYFEGRSTKSLVMVSRLQLGVYVPGVGGPSSALDSIG
jgi:hypothetical protein